MIVLLLKITLQLDFEIFFLILYVIKNTFLQEVEVQAKKGRDTWI